VAEHKGEVIVEGLDRFPGARWFPEARLNFAENLLRSNSDQEALVFRGERGERRGLSFRKLHQKVARLAHALEQLGIAPSDRIAALMPNLPETVIAMLATTSLGATWSSCSPDFGLQGVLDRFGQIEPRVLFVADGYVYGGKSFDSLEKVRAIQEAIPSLERIVVVPFLREDPDLKDLEGSQDWESFLSRGTWERPHFRALPFDHPLYIMYSSGTTGLPKCIVHGAGGTLLQHLKEHAFHCNLSPGDRLFYFTTCGWMMWNWLVSALALEVTVLLFDGSPFEPSSRTLWDLASEEKANIFGTSARYLAAVEKVGLKPRESHDLSALRAILSTGSPLTPESFTYVYRDVKSDVQLSSISGGTDILSCFALGSPVLPVYQGELQTLGLGMDVAVFDEKGQELCGEKGELVCRTPFPSCPIGFWKDPDQKRFREAYFDVYPNIWRHGDWVEITERGGMVIYGRSDAVLNPGGVRIGTAEIYRQVERLDEVLESLVIGQEWRGDVRVVLFVRLRDGVILDKPLIARIKKEIRHNTTPRHVPARVLAVPDIPRTLSGKIVELAVRNVVHGKAVKNRDALANPEALAFFEKLPTLQK
jgi:acetoacetyl-CoA synthetase